MTAERPVSAALDQQGCLEVTRVCVKGPPARVVGLRSDNLLKRLKVDRFGLRPAVARPSGMDRSILF